MPCTSPEKGLFLVTFLAKSIANWLHQVGPFSDPYAALASWASQILLITDIVSAYDYLLQNDSAIRYQTILMKAQLDFPSKEFSRKGGFFTLSTLFFAQTSTRKPSPPTKAPSLTETLPLLSA